MNVICYGESVIIQRSLTDRENRLLNSGVFHGIMTKQACLLS